MNAEILLSDKFVEYSAKVTALHERKKELNAEFKKLHEKWKADVAAIEAEAIDLHSEFQQWTDQQVATKVTKAPAAKTA